jgi:hypothetical protein
MAAPDDPHLVERISIAFEKIAISAAAQRTQGAQSAAPSFIADVA